MLFQIYRVRRNLITTDVYCVLQIGSSAIFIRALCSILSVPQLPERLAENLPKALFAFSSDDQSILEYGHKIEILIIYTRIIEKSQSWHKSGAKRGTDIAAIMLSKSLA
jgi:hypothetical protein